MNRDRSTEDDWRSLEGIVDQLERISSTASVDPDVPMLEVGVDSVELLEWLLALEEETGISLDELSNGLPDLDTLTIRQLHRHLEELPR